MGAASGREDGGSGVSRRSFGVEWLREGALEEVGGLDELHNQPMSTDGV